MPGAAGRDLSETGPTRPAPTRPVLSARSPADPRPPPAATRVPLRVFYEAAARRQVTSKGRASLAVALRRQSLMPNDKGLWECGNPSCGFPKAVGRGLCGPPPGISIGRSSRSMHPGRPFAPGEMGQPSIRAGRGRVAVAAHEVMRNCRGWHYLCDGALGPPRRGPCSPPYRSAQPVKLLPCGRSGRRGRSGPAVVKLGRVAPEGKQDATQSARQCHYGHPPAAPRRQVVGPAA